MHVELQDQIDSRPPGQPAELPVLRRAAARHVRRPRHVAAVRELSAGGPAQRDGAVLSAARLRSASSASWCSSRSTSAPEDIFTEYAYFSSYSDSWLEHARALRRDDRSSGFGLGRGQPGRRAGAATTATCCSTSSSAASRRSASSRPPTSRRSREREGRPDPRRVLRRRAGATSWWRTDAGPTWWSATTCWRRCPTSTTSSPAWRALLAPDGVLTIEFPHLLRLIEENQFDTIYHEHFSYFSFLTAERIFARARADGVRRRGAADARRLAARLRPARRTDGAAGRGQRVARAARSASDALGFDRRSSGYARFARAGRGDQAAAARVPDRGRARGQARRRLRRARQGQHAAQLLRHPHRFPRLHGRSQPVQAGAVPARARTSRSATGGARARPARLRPDPALEPEGRDRRPARVRAGVGRAASCVPIPEVAGACEGRAVLRRPGPADARGLGGRAEADGPDRQPADPLARDEVLRALRPHRLHALPRLQGRGHQGVLPHLQRGDGQRLRAVRRRREGPPAEDRHPGLEHHLRRHRPARVDRRAAAGGPPPARPTTRSSSPTTATR